MWFMWGIWHHLCRDLWITVIVTHFEGKDWMESTHFEGQLQTASWQTSIDDIANKPRSILQTRMVCYDSEWLIASLVWRTLFFIFYGWAENHSSGPVVKWMYYTKGTVSNAVILPNSQSVSWKSTLIWFGIITLNDCEVSLNKALPHMWLNTSLIFVCPFHYFLKGYIFRYILKVFSPVRLGWYPQLKLI